MNQKGFTLLEVMVSLIIFGVVASGMLGSFITYLKFNSQSELRSQSMAAAQVVLDELRLQDPSTLPTSGSLPIDYIDVGDRTFQVETYICLEPAYCISANVRHLTVSVILNDEQMFEVETVYTKLN